VSKIRLSVQQDQEDALSELILSLEKILSCKISASPVAAIYEAESDEPKVLAILQDMFSENGPAPVVEKSVEKVSKPGKKEKKKRVVAFHTRQDLKYKVLNGPEQGTELTGGGLALKLKAGTLPVGTHLSHPKKGEQIVVKTREGTDIPTMIITAVGEEIGEVQA
jgi:hypothetical protein